MQYTTNTKNNRAIQIRAIIYDTNVDETIELTLSEDDDIKKFRIAFDAKINSWNCATNSKMKFSFRKTENEKIWKVTRLS